MNFRSIGIVIILGVCGRHAISVAAEVAHPRIPGFERFYSGSVERPVGDDDEPIKLDPVTGGRILLSELNCLSCHAAEETTTKLLSPKQAPILDGIGSRVKVEWIRSYLANPHAARPGTTMPDVLSGLPEATRAANVEALTHFLASTGNVPEGHSNATAAQKGETLFRTVGCLACHNAQTENAPEIATSVILPDVSKKYSMPSLLAFLKDPLKSRPSGRMPALGLSDEDYQNISHYFVRGGVLTLNTKLEHRGHVRLDHPRALRDPRDRRIPNGG